MFMQDGATSRTATPVKAFLIQTFREDKIIRRRCRFPWPTLSPDLTLADFWLWGYLKSLVYQSDPSIQSVRTVRFNLSRGVMYIRVDRKV
ncbi:hypothetical protein AVEN_225217-1 [Araneus ventricosus]|uniref:DUF5641 domain-containing protein n=1 Tax=Araneus ventricosus TaxID=182803 RepID=A0A4Y2AMQ5_ARAVE|nr:hypothetical protein AVEN_225217-1 [Araneus ventricosus]